MFQINQTNINFDKKNLFTITHIIFLKIVFSIFNIDIEFMKISKLYLISYIIAKLLLIIYFIKLINKTIIRIAFNKNEKNFHYIYINIFTVLTVITIGFFQVYELNKNNLILNLIACLVLLLYNINFIKNF